MRINWKVRFKNPYFWIGLIAVILSAVGAEPEIFTSWIILLDKIKSLLGNPFLVGCTIIAVVGFLNDPTTSGLSDSIKALSYKKPKKE